MPSPTYFERFRQAILALPVKGEAERYEKSDLLQPHFQLFSEAGLEVYYAPFHYLNEVARVVLLGLTPGWTQMEAAFRAARQGKDWRKAWRIRVCSSGFKKPGVSVGLCGKISSQCWTGLI